MAQEKSEAIVLRGVDFSETSRILTLLTPHRGKIGCLARGMRRKNSPLAAVLDSYNRVEVVYAWKDGRNVQNLIEASLLDAWQPMKRDLESGAYASLILELAMKTVHENEPSQMVYDMVVQGFGALAQSGGDARAKCAWLVLQLLRISGFAPSLEGGLQCAEQAVRRGADAHGAFPCCRCHGGARLSRHDLEALQAMAESGDRCPEVVLEPGVLPVLAAFAACQLETEFRSMRVIEKVLS
ncbi:MAG: DNA repair protein RecO [Candidatus Hydrogenedentes bacterium]|nr:DNA repair protein RecO [Candidatus Hydrogenedentota bacterium]